MVMLKNPLTTKERFQIPRLIGHNMADYYTWVATEIERSCDKQTPCSDITDSIMRLANPSLMQIGTLMYSDKITLNQYTDPITVDRITDALDNFKLVMNASLGKDIADIKITTKRKFLSNIGLINGVLMNLCGNAKMATGGKKEQRISLVCEEYSHFPETATFIPEGARDYNEFIAFRVHDNGKGFPQVSNNRQMLFEGEGFPTARGEMLKRYFTTCPQNREHGFGLYFTGLVAKVLRAPVEIQSVPGDTTVSFYHPVFEQD
jgi:signal transduction histidine kinase